MEAARSGKPMGAAAIASVEGKKNGTAMTMAVQCTGTVELQWWYFPSLQRLS